MVAPLRRLVLAIGLEVTACLCLVTLPAHELVRLAGLERAGHLERTREEGVGKARGARPSGLALRAPDRVRLWQSGDVSSGV